ncbi:unnamed protein product [Prorocentrum cordatum]|uniref:Uncharacterized protein n=1 Tax=Prorocentrum cordatum TaxID=2364126 RepID=A0ABN9RB87_9DINO|nr:unnamed protein product [Polarella glacialis]
MRDLSAATLTQTNAVKAKELLTTEYRRVSRQTSQAMISAWKRRLQSSTRASYQWVSGSGPTVKGAMLIPNGSFTADRQEQFDVVLKIWLFFFHKFKDQKEDVEGFMGMFRTHISEGRLCSYGP